MKSVETAPGDATVRARVWLPVDHAEISLAAAASGLGCGAVADHDVVGGAVAEIGGRVVGGTVSCECGAPELPQEPSAIMALRAATGRLRCTGKVSRIGDRSGHRAKISACMTP